jgi:hypothetical protein
MECVPVAKADVDRVAAPFFVRPVPMGIPPSSNVTISPFGMAPDIGVTVAVNVTSCPANAGEPDEARVVVVEILLTTWLSAGEALGPSLTSPE